MPTSKSTRPFRKSKKVISKKNLNIKNKLTYIFFLIVAIGSLSGLYLNRTNIFNYFGKTEDLSVDVVTMYGSCRNSTESKWGEWCVYTGNDATPDKVVNGFDNIYHPSIYWRNGSWNMFVGGWRNAASQSYNDKIYRLKTTDPKGMTGWYLVNNPRTGKDSYVDNEWEDSTSLNPPSEILSKLQSNAASFSTSSVSPYRSWHSVQPAVFASENYPSGITCCDTLYYSYDSGIANESLYRSPETYVVINWLYMDSNGYPNKAGSSSTTKNPMISYLDYWNSGDKSVISVSDPNVVYDKKTNRFYVVYTEWRGRHADSGRLNITIGLASASWTSNKYQIVAKNIINLGDKVAVTNPQLVMGPDSKYYLFYTRNASHLGGGQESEFRLAIADNITGPYKDYGIVLKPPSNDNIGQSLTTPYVFCNKNINRWQMMFSFASSGVNNQIYTAFLDKDCSTPPVSREESLVKHYYKQMISMEIKDPSDSGFQWHVGYLKSSGCKADIKNFSNSWQFNQGPKSKASNQQYVDILYKTILGRPADNTPGGSNWWVAQLDSKTMTRDSIVDRLSSTSEAAAACSQGKIIY